MTRRLALAMFLTVWAMLIAGGAVVYIAARSLILADLDASLVQQACQLPELLVAQPQPMSASAPVADEMRYLISNDRGQKVASSSSRSLQVPTPPVKDASFFLLSDGTRMRKVVIHALAKPTSAGAEPTSVTVVYSGSAARFDALMQQLLVALTVMGIVGGGVAAWIASAVSRATLRPLRKTADVVGAIDERHLGRRIEVDKLPKELRPMAERLNAMLERIEVAFARRQQFLADAAHELRTPVAAMVAALEVSLRHPRDAEGYRRYIERGLSDAKLMRRLVEGLMEQARGETLVHDEKVETVDLSLLLNQCADIASALAGERGVELTRDVPAGLKLQTQPQRLRSVVINLLANAVQHNRENGNVALSCEPRDTTLILRVHDTGCGIASEQLPHVFEPFFRGDASRRESGHLGLGLFLVRTHLDALGGKCTVQSQEGIGTTFEVALPYSRTSSTGSNDEKAEVKEVLRRPSLIEG